MLTRQQNVSRIVFMQISAAIIEIYLCQYISATIIDNWQNKVFTTKSWYGRSIQGFMNKEIPLS